MGREAHLVWAVPRIATLAAFVAVGLIVCAPHHAIGAAFITNGTITLGVNDHGNLNVTDTTLPGYPGPSIAGTVAAGLRFNPTNADATAPACLCEGWGAAIDAGPGLSFNGFVNRGLLPPDDLSNLSLVSFSSTTSTATSVVTINDTLGAPALQVTHAFLPSASPNLYQVDVTITNVSGGALGAGPTAVRYRRVMDWDVEPTAQSEFITLDGLPATNVIGASAHGFASANPLAGAPLDWGGCGTNTNFTDCGPADLGAVFDFAFPALAAGEQRVLQIFYGAAPTEAAADLARAVAGVEVFSSGQCNGAAELLSPPACNAVAGTPNTFIFGFGRVGGTAPPPPTSEPSPQPGPSPTPGPSPQPEPAPVPAHVPVPEPATWVLLSTGLAGLVGARWRQKRQADRAR